MSKPVWHQTPMPGRRELEVAAGLGYSHGMGMGSLAKYRKIIMIVGFSIFLLGALGRWHRERQLGSVQQKSTEIESPTESWLRDCVSYACRVLPSRGSECDSTCKQAVSEGPPHAQAERVALACKKYCVSVSTPTPSCAAQCLVQEARRSVYAE